MDCREKIEGGGAMVIKDVVKIEDFARTCFQILKSDRDVNIAVGGMTGEGKSTFSTLLQKHYSKIAVVDWDFSNMTWSRKELLTWIDGEGKDRKGQKAEYSAILPDELISMFYKRNWYEDAQKGAVELFNKCRDRHLFIVGNVPDFWDLDTGFLSRIRFYIYIPRRGVAWVFQQENNPFSTDKWNKTLNRKLFKKRNNPYSIPNFICEIHFPDWTPEEKKRYMEIRNTKRRNTEGQNKKVIKYKDIQKQRNELIRFIITAKKYFSLEEIRSISQKTIADITKLDPTTISYIVLGKTEV